MAVKKLPVTYIYIYVTGRFFTAIYQEISLSKLSHIE